MLMFFDLSPIELIVLLGMSVVLFGPDKLPAAAASAARLLRQFRAFTESSKAQVREQLGPEFADLGIEHLDPRRFVREHLGEEAGDIRGTFDQVRRDLHPTLNEPTATVDQNPHVAAAMSDQYLDAT
jgi:sec-independent protein translocase protein TatB